tara:strand:- start:5198 stop:5560 length:363 start_codon:yes stop_codon:yes gene_type:complete
MPRYKVTLYVRCQDLPAGEEQPGFDIGCALQERGLHAAREALDDALQDALEEHRKGHLALSVYQDDWDVVASRVDDAGDEEDDGLIYEQLADLQWDELCDAGKRIAAQREPCFDDREDYR